MKRSRKTGAMVVFSFAGAMVVTACGDDGASTPAPDCCADVAPDAADVAVGDDTQDDDVAVVAQGPQARIFPIDPLTTPQTVLVGLPNLPEEPTVLEGPFARVRSCSRDLENGTRNSYEFGQTTLDTVSCVPRHNANAVDGNYFHITPPATPAEDDGAFAEVMMYHHMSLIHRYFSVDYSIKDRDEPLNAVTNIQTWVSTCNDWTQWTNAAYVPREALDYLMLGLDLADTPGDAIVFSGTAERNFALDSTVIYHEYTHAILGATRLSGTFLDDQGFNNLPGALNEAYADYFAGTLTGESAVGQFALNDIAAADFCGVASDEDTLENYARDMQSERRCPDDLVGEVHADSEIFSVALWEMREVLGQKDADMIALYAVLQLTNESDFTSAANATIEAARDIFDDAKAEVVKGIFESRNLVACERIVPAASVGAREIAFRHEGTRVFGDANPFPGYAPGYMQYGIDVPAGTKRVVLQLTAVSGRGGPVTLDIEGAFRFGGAVRYQLGRAAGQATHNADILRANNGATLELFNADGTDLQTGSWALSLHNKSRRTFRLVAIDVAFQ